MLRRIFCHTFPPDGIVIEVAHHIGKDGVFPRGSQRIGIGFFRGAGGDTEEAIFRIHGPEPAVGANPQPGNIVAHAPGLVALDSVALRRDQHGQIGLAAGGREGGTDIFGLTLGIFNAQNQHVFGEPTFVAAKARGDPKGKALFALQHIAAIAGVDGHDGVVLRKLDNIAVLWIQSGLGMQTADEIGGISDAVEYFVADAGHNRHVEHDIDGVGQLNAVLCKGRADNAHGIGNGVHGAALHGAVVQLIEFFVHLRRVNPVVGGAGILLLFGADEGTALHPGDIAGIGAVQIAAGQLLLVQFHRLQAPCYGAFPTAPRLR